MMDNEKIIRKRYLSMVQFRASVSVTGRNTPQTCLV